MRLPAGTRLGHFEIIALAGAGGMGEVYRARDERLERDVALKLLPAGTVADAAARERFHREALTLSRINHPNIASIYDFETHDGLDFLVMEFVDGMTLHERLARGPLPEAEVTRLALQIAEALEDAHEHGVVHRDLKPGNIMVTSRGRVKVLDFGLARPASPIETDASSETQSGTGTLAGTLPYMAPEQLANSAIDARTDVYALGVVLYEMATGRRPFDGKYPAVLAGDILHRTPVAPRSLNPAISPRLEAIVLKALRKNAAERYQSAREILSALTGPIAEAVAPERPSVSALLPRSQSAFVGRAAEIADGRTCLAAARLVTFTGAGGCGKTRLAIELAAAVREDYPDGTCLVELGPVTDGDLVPQTIAAALKVPKQSGRPLLETLCDALEARHLLLVIDNCEHVLDAVAEVILALLGSCPALRVLATSREALRVPGEVCRRVPSLSFPDAGCGVTDAMAFEAVQLFVERATAIAPTFALTAKNAEDVVQICRRLDGIPLAIELAAARIRLLSPREIASRLDDRFHLLTSDSRGALARHQTLRALIDWSYQLLPDAEKLLCQRLSTFAGSWTIEAAEAVCADARRGGPGGEPAIASGDVLDLMTKLVEKSLVQVEEQRGTMRCRFLETVREYAAEKLEPVEAEAVSRRHADYFLSRAEGSVGRLDLVERLAELELDLDNFRAALAWSHRAGGPAVLGLKLAVSLGSLWAMRGQVSEGRMWLRRLLEGAEGAPPEVLAPALVLLGKLAWLEARFDESVASYEKSLAICERLGDRSGMAVALCGIGNVARHRRDYPRAAGAYEATLSIYHELGDRGGMSSVLNNMGALAWNQNELERAIALYREALEISRELGDTWGIASRLGNLAEVTLHHGEVAEAAALHRESLRRWVELGDRRSIAEGLEMFVETLCAQGRMELAARVLGAVEALRTAIGCPRPPVDQETVQKAMDSARAALGEDRFERAWSEGLALRPEEAVAAASELP